MSIFGLNHRTDRLTPEPETITIAGRSDDDTPPPLLSSSSDDGRIRSPCSSWPNDTSVLFMRGLLCLFGSRCDN